MSYEDLKEAQAKRAAKDAAKAKAKGKRGRKRKNPEPEPEQPTAGKAKRGRKRKTPESEQEEDNTSERNMVESARLLSPTRQSQRPRWLGLMNSRLLQWRG
jgi:hypothetical protein